MATPEVQEAAAKERIIKHMNADHHDSIRRYLEALKKKSFYQVRNARMTDVTLNEMKFSCGGEVLTIPFDPPMKSLREARERLVELDKSSLQILGRSSITVDTYIPPTAHPFHLINFATCFSVYLAFCRAANFKPGSFLFDNVLYPFPRFTSFCLAIRVYLMVIMLGIHAFETNIMVKKLARHGVTPLQGIWWMWAGSCFVEGVTSFWRLDGIVDEKRREKEAKKY